jgi:hypothetical protein
MKQAAIVGLALASVILTHGAQAASYATSVVDYSPGALSGSVTSYTNASSFVGSPATENPGYPPGSPSDPVTPFNGPYLTSQIAALGAGGSLTVYFADPIRNDPANPFGRDFIVYGAVALNDANWPNGVSDGTFFGDLGGVTRISVSADGQTFYTLDPNQAPLTEAGLPTDSAGTFGLTANPSLQPANFNGMSLSQIRALYAGSAGGTSYDLAWAQNALGQPVNLSSVNYVRVDMLSGQTKIDAIAAVPEPSVWALGLAGLAGLIGWRKYRTSRAS